MGAERLGDLGELGVGHQARLELADRLGLALREHPQRRFLHRRPAGVVEQHHQDRQLVLLRHREHRRRAAEVEAAVADHLYHQLVRRRELGAERHAARPAEPAAAGTHAGVRHRPLELEQAGAGVADAFVVDEVVGLQELVQLGEQIVRIDLVGLALVGGHLGRALAPGFALLGQRCDALLRRLLEFRRGLLLQLLQQLAEDDAGVALHAEVAGEGPHRRGGLQRIDVDVRPERLVLVRDVAGNHGTSTSTSMPTSARGRCLFGE